MLQRHPPVLSLPGPKNTRQGSRNGRRNYLLQHVRFTGILNLVQNNCVLHNEVATDNSDTQPLHHVRSQDHQAEIVSSGLLQSHPHSLLLFIVASLVTSYLCTSVKYDNKSKSKVQIILFVVGHLNVPKTAVILYTVQWLINEFLKCMLLLKIEQYIKY